MFKRPWWYNPREFLQTMPSICSDPKAQNVIYRVKVGLERRIERLKMNQDKVTVCEYPFHKLQAHQKTYSLGFLSPLAANDISKKLAHGTPGKQCLRSGNSDYF